MATTYDDGMVRIDDDGVTLRRYYFPTFQAKHISWSEVSQVTAEDVTWFRGRGRIWGSSIPLTRWMPLDVHRPRRTELIVLDVGKHLHPTFTPERPEEALTAIHVRHPVD